MKRLSALIPLAAGLVAMAPVPAAAQDDSSDKINMVIAYGDDDCPESTGDEIVVCARMDESERYRIPPNLRTSEAPENKSWTERVKSFERVGAFGTQSCTPEGAGGWTGCTQQLIDAAYAEKRQSSDIRFGQLIEEERAKRLSTIDEDAAAEQARVEVIEKEYMDRLERERQGTLPDEAQPLPAVGEGVQEDEPNN